MSKILELPDNLLSQSSSRVWSGVTVEVTEYTCEGRALMLLPFVDKTRLNVILEEVSNDRCEAREKPYLPCPVEYKPRCMSLFPADMELWGYSADVRYIKDVQIAFDSGSLSELLQFREDIDLANTPRHRFTDDRIWYLVRLLADTVEDPDPSAQLYGDSLVTAIASRLIAKGEKASRPTGGLSPLQLRDALSFLDAQLPSRVDLATLASLAGLSPSHYCRAFKASTGLAPYQWQLQARIERAKGLLLNTNRSLEEIAEATGFADTVHFGRTFRKLTGVTPGNWRGERVT